MLRNISIAILLLAAAGAAQAECAVTDPTGTPLNIRATPNGRIVGTLRNGTRVSIETVTYDSQGRAWANIGIGWVFREFIRCY